MNNMKTVFCKDCKYFFTHNSSPYYYCKPPNLGISLITGDVKIGTVSEIRQNPDFCGKDGKWFEPKDKKPIKKSFWSNLFKKLSSSKI